MQIAKLFSHFDSRDGKVSYAYDNDKKRSQTNLTMVCIFLEWLSEMESGRPLAFPHGIICPVFIKLFNIPVLSQPRGES